MALSDSSAVDAAVLAVLQNDLPLRALLPDGVWFDLVGRTNPSQYGLITQQHHEDVPTLGGTGGWERFLYLVKAVMLDTSGGNAKAAAYRIHELLHDAVFPVTGYALMLSQRAERVRYSEIDDVTDQNWHHRGGQYEVIVAPLGMTDAERSAELAAA